MDKIPLFVSRGAIAANVDSQMEALTVEIDKVTEQYGEPTLIIYDTRSRCLEGDEKEGSVIDKFVRNVDEFAPPDTAKVVVHHSGHTNKERSQGASNWGAALDAEFRIDWKDKNINQVTHASIENKISHSWMDTYWALYFS